MDESLIDDIHPQDVQEADLVVFFEQQLDPHANSMAAFAAKDPTDKAAFMAKWEKILADKKACISTANWTMAWA